MVWWWLTGAPLDAAVLLEHVVTGAILTLGLVGLAWPRRRRWSRWGAYGTLAWLWSATVGEAGLRALAWVAILAVTSASLLVGDARDRRRGALGPLGPHAAGALGAGAAAHLTHYAFALDYAGAGRSLAFALAALATVSAAALTIALAVGARWARALGPLTAGLVLGLAVFALSGEPPPLERARPAVRWEELAAHARAVSWAPSLMFAVCAAALPAWRAPR